ncbi:hypothetical protein ACO22_02570 [Paracoccidioides brasiliensis]|uniref:DUF7732 domain-containing protein n=1 Tax=Paracoccidioides brasiliensis TaxID=121759 RepID=A0A1D2JIB4_PARBR|nr:hypothetical protein ACO22_02570 [Paracoccidioides brasiliensis]
MRLSHGLALCVFLSLSCTVTPVNIPLADIHVAHIDAREVINPGPVDSPKFFDLEKQEGVAVAGGGVVVEGVEEEEEEAEYLEAGVEDEAVEVDQRGEEVEVHLGEEVQGRLELDPQGINIGGSTRSGSGTPRSFGEGGFYPGGAAVPYTAGGRSRMGLLPFAFLPIAALAFFPGVWLFGAHAYHIGHYNHRNTSDPNANVTQIPIECLCQRFGVCGCDKNDNTTYIDQLLSEKDRDGLPKNTSTIVVATVNGTRTIYVNGTLANGTTSSDPSIKDSSSSFTSPPVLSMLSGYWVMASLFVATVTLI